MISTGFQAYQASLYTLQTASRTPDTGDSGGGGIFLFFLFIVWIGFAVYFWRQRRPIDITVQTSAKVDDVVQHAIQTYSHKGWSVTSNTGTTATFYRNLKPGCLPTLLLFCLGFIPGLIYLFIGGKDLTATISAREIGPSTTSVRITGNAQGFGGLAPAKQTSKRLPPVAGAHISNPELAAGN
jgi:hypothetical protein